MPSARHRLLVAPAPPHPDASRQTQRRESKDRHPGIAAIYGIDEACSWGRMGLVVVVDPTQRR